VVRYDSHTKKIFVTNDFCFGTIPKIKIITSREHWFETYYGVNQQTFDSIQDLIRSLNAKKRNLKNMRRKT